MTKGKQIPVPIKSVIVGFSGVGKTSLLFTYTTGVFPSEYIPLVYDTYTNYPEVGVLDDKLYSLSLWDTGGGEDYSTLRPLSYPLSDVFILLFSVSDKEERFEQIQSDWWSELNHHCPDVPIVLVGSKIDLRDKEGIQTVTTEEGQAMAENIGAKKYMEISSLENRGVRELFEEVIRLGFQAKKKKKKKCSIL